MTQVIIVSGTSWTVPADWNSADNSIETIGGGGGGGTSAGGNDAGGGGGGAYSQIINLALTPGAAVVYQVGTGGQANAAGGDTWFNGASFATSSVGAKGGRGASGFAGGAGGDQASGIGSIRFSGGSGGTSTNSQNGGAGGGGAAGRNGAGKPGGLSAENSGSGGGGAGGGSSTPGSDGSASMGGIGGDGPGGNLTAPGGTGAVAGSSTAAAGAYGSGGGGGASGGSPGQAAGAPGGPGVDIDGTHGSGGGGGGGGYSNASNANGGGGGFYGGGGGGTGYAPGLGVGGAGAQGIIVINYAPTAAQAVTADNRLALESKGAVCHGELGPTQFLASNNAGNACNPIEWLALHRDYRQAAVEGTATVNSQAASYGLEVALRTACLTRLVGEGIVSVGCDLKLSFGALSVLSCPALSIIEFVTGAARILTSGTALLEWGDQPGTAVVSTGRFLRSPGRIRVVAGGGSARPLRVQ